MDKGHCEYCNSEFFCKKISKLRKYCSRSCIDKAYYRRNEKTRERRKKATREWVKNNPEKHKQHVKKAFFKFYTTKRERFNELMMKGYRRNKDKWQSRTYTLAIVKGNLGFKKRFLFDKECKKCGTTNDLQIHHEIYPRKVKNIVIASKQGKIYFLCRTHHLEVRKVNS